jgi:hypothetical protein
VTTPWVTTPDATSTFRLPAGSDLLDAAVSSRLAAAAYTAPPSVGAIDTRLTSGRDSGSWTTGSASPTAAAVATAV